MGSNILYLLAGPSLATNMGRMLSLDFKMPEFKAIPISKYLLEYECHTCIVVGSSSCFVLCGNIFHSFKFALWPQEPKCPTVCKISSERK